MENLLQQKILDNTVEAYLYVLATILLMLLLKRFISKYLANQLYKAITKKRNQTARQSFLDLVAGPLGLFLFLSITIIAVDKLQFPGVLDFKVYRVNSRQMIESLANGVMVIVFIRLCLRVIDFIAIVLEEKANLTVDQTDNQLIIFFKDFFKVILVIIGILLIMKFSFNKPVGNVLTGLSIVGAALALATRESLENLIASFIIFFDRPFAVGDLVKVNGFTGNIEKIGLRSTRIRTVEKTYISVPNKQMVDTIVDNISLRTQRKAELRIELDLAASATQLEAFTVAAKKILDKPDILSTVVFLAETGKNAHVVIIEFFTSMDQSIEAFNQLRQQINLEIIGWLEEHHLQLAAANTDVTVRQANS
jgi:MscS family membrane protein